MNRRSCRSFLVSLVLAFATLLAGPGCQESRFPFDLRESDDVLEDVPTGDSAEDAADGTNPDSGPREQNIRILQPSASELVVVAGPVDFLVSYDDPAGMPATITLSGAGTASSSVEVAGSGEYTIKFTPVPEAQGSQSIRIEAVSGDGRNVHVDRAFVVDTVPPVITFESPTPEPYSIVSDTMPLHFRVYDGVSKVHRVDVGVMGFGWNWSPLDGSYVEQFDSGEGGLPAIPVTGWPSGTYTVEVRADDGVPGHSLTARRAFSVIREAEFSPSGAGVPTPPARGIGGAGIRVGSGAERRWGIVTSRGVYVRESDGVRTVSTGFNCDGTLWGVGDYNSDGMDDFAGYCRDPLQQRFVYMLQEPDGSFTEMPIMLGEVTLIDVATGDLNNDGYADVAYLESELSTLSLVKVVLSRTGEDGQLTGWSEVQEYIGASNAGQIVIGRFSDNGRPSVLVSSFDTGMYTVFPAADDGTLMMGENRLVLEFPFVVTAAANFCSPDDLPDVVISADDNCKSRTMYLFRKEPGYIPVIRFAALPAALTPSFIETGDVDGNGTGDILMLCKGARTILFFRGGPDCANYEFADGGYGLVAGDATHIWLSDWNNDGYKDLFTLTSEGIKVTYFVMDEDGGHFDGAHQVRFAESPTQFTVGHFVKRLEGEGANWLDLASINKGAVYVLTADNILHQPIVPVSLKVFPPDYSEPPDPAEDVIVRGGIVPGVSSSGVSTAGLSPGFVPGKYMTSLSSDLYGGSSDLDGLAMTGTKSETMEDPFTSAVMSFYEWTRHTSYVDYSKVRAGNKPAIAASGVFDPDVPDSGATDIAYIWHQERTSTASPNYFLQPWRGLGDGTFTTDMIGGISMLPIKIPENRYPASMFAYPLRRTLGEMLSGTTVTPDLIVSNLGTSDFTVFLGEGNGRFLAKYDGSLDFAVGLPAIDVVAGYLDEPVDGRSLDEAAMGELPDVVTLTRQDASSVMVVSFAFGRQELEDRGLDVGFEVPAAYVIYQPGTEYKPNPAPEPKAVDLADVTGDGFLDILVLDKARSSVLVYVNHGNRQFSDPLEFFTGALPTSIVSADVDADGCTDILTGDEAGSTISILHNRLCDVASGSGGM